ncbi:MAG: DUF547 domain-containing protein [Acidimicrobiia bacterium]|nr:DUF547 domain-containing protein [Acidimicrobiia bacterium]
MPAGVRRLSGGMDGPNPLLVGWSIARSLVATRTPRPFGEGNVGASQFDAVLKELATGGTSVLGALGPDLDAVIATLAKVDPDGLSPSGALAFWIDLYNAGALRLAATASGDGAPSVLRVPGAFSRPFVEVAGERLSLDAVEHAKVRRFGDPRIHAALVCGSVSCPTLRAGAYSGGDLDADLDHQMRAFLSGGGATVESGVVTLSRVFSWYGSDFVRPHRMPTFLPTSRRSVLAALTRWLPFDVPPDAEVAFQSYDWGLRCSVG